MTSLLGWRFSAHAEARLAKRMGLLMDMKVEAEISRLIDSTGRPVRIYGNRTMYEITIYGVLMIAVCEPAKRAVVTFLDGKRWREKHGGKQKRSRRFVSKGSEGEEE